jgi:hypothetical protein
MRAARTASAFSGRIIDLIIIIIVSSPKSYVGVSLQVIGR